MSTPYGRIFGNTVKNEGETMKSKTEIKALSDELKELISQGQAQVDQVREEMKTKGIGMDRTCKLQLRDDCKNVEKLIQKIQKGEKLEENTEKLKRAMIVLHTTSQGILY